MLVDTHCHLDFPQFDPDRESVLKRAIDADVSRLVNVGADLKSSLASCELADKFAEIFAAVGVHPHDADNFTPQLKSRIALLAKNNKVAAIGEIGLDFFRNLAKADNQKTAFRELIKLAKDLGLPVIVHSRGADSQALEILKEMQPLKAVIHCFSAGADFLKNCLDLGFYVSFTCNITYDKSKDLREVVKIARLERMMLETDAPYLPPQDLRGKRNEPANIKTLAWELAKIKQVEIADLARVTTENAFRFFKLK